MLLVQRLFRGLGPLSLVIFVFCAFFSDPGKNAWAGLFGSNEHKEALKSAEKDISSLLQILGNPALPFHNSRSKNLVAFTALPKEDSGDISPESVDGGTSAYWEFTLKAPLSRVASYLFNPKVPAEAVMPGMVRLGGWKNPDQAAQALTGISGTLPDAESPIFLRGVEHEESTPDVNSGVYYSYDLDRLLAAYKAPEGNVIISISRLKDKSSVGMKGVAFGSAKDWYFFYSGIKGNLLKMVGWADSFIYDSITVNVFLEQTPGQTKVALFKWVNAGWKGMNMVKNKHVLAGCKSMGKMLKEVFGTASMPSADAIAAKAAEVNALSDQDLRARLTPFAGFLERQAAGNDTLDRDEFRAIIEGGKYLDILNREQMAAELIKDYIRKAVLNSSFTQGARP